MTHNPVMERAPRTTVEQLAAPPSIFPGPMVVERQLPGQRNSWVFNDLSNDVSSPASCLTPSPLDNPPERTFLSNPLKDILGHTFTSNRHTPVVLVSTNRSGTHSLLKNANPQNPATRFNLLMKSGMVQSQPQVVVTVLDPTERSATSLYRCNLVRNANAVHPLNLPHLRRPQRTVSYGSLYVMRSSKFLPSDDKWPNGI